LTAPVRLVFQTAGYLTLTQALPEPEAVDVNPTTAVVAAFNRPVVPLGTDQATLPVGFTLEPAASGRGEWVNTSTYIFYPDPPLEGGRTYTVQINPNLHSLEGSPLEVANRWSFTTMPPRLVSVEPMPEDGRLRLDSDIVLIFNQPMDAQSVEASFNLWGPGNTPVPGEFSWNEDFTTLRFTPDRWLKRGAEYTLQLSGQAQAGGGSRLGSDLIYNYVTVSTLAVTSSEPVAGGVKPPYGSITLRFSGPIADQNVLQYISVDPPVADLDGWWNEHDQTLNIHGTFKPQTDYALQLSPQLADPWGGTLARPYTLNFRTAPLEPQIFVTAGTDVLFLTPQDASLPVQVTNLNNLPLSVGSVPLGDFIAMVSGPDAYDLRKRYRAADQRDWQQAVEITPDRSQSVNLYVSPAEQPLEPGLYYLRFDLPDGRMFAGPYLLVVSNVQLTLKLSATEVFVWAVDLRGNQPLPNAPVAILDENGNTMLTGLRHGAFKLGPGYSQLGFWAAQRLLRTPPDGISLYRPPNLSAWPDSVFPGCRAPGLQRALQPPTDGEPAADAFQRLQ